MHTTREPFSAQARTIRSFSSSRPGCASSGLIYQRRTFALIGRVGLVPKLDCPPSLRLPHRTRSPNREISVVACLRHSKGDVHPLVGTTAATWKRHLPCGMIGTHDLDQVPRQVVDGAMTAETADDDNLAVASAIDQALYLVRRRQCAPIRSLKRPTFFARTGHRPSAPATALSLDS